MKKNRYGEIAQNLLICGARQAAVLLARNVRGKFPIDEMVEEIGASPEELEELIRIFSEEFVAEFIAEFFRE